METRPLLYTAFKLLVFAVAMFAFGYGLVPLYEKICEAAGINNLLNPSADAGEFSTGADDDRLIRAEFIASARGMVAMRPNMSLADLRPGTTYTVIYTLKNLTDKPLVAQAVPSYSPARAERWFKKTHCFCFEQLRLKPREVRLSPVVFVIDPALPDDIKTLSLAYTFFEIEGAS